MNAENLTIHLPGNVVIRGDECELQTEGEKVRVLVPMLTLAKALADFYAETAIALEQQQ